MKFTSVDEIVSITNIEIANFCNMNGGLSPNEIYLGTYALNVLIASNIPKNEPIGSVRLHDDIRFMGMKVYEVTKPVDHIRVARNPNLFW